MNIKIVVADNGNLCGFKRRIFYKNIALYIMLSENMTFRQPPGKSLPLGRDARLVFFTAYNAA